MENKVNPLVAGAVSRAPMLISVELGSTSRIVKEVYAIGKGTIVELDKFAGEPLDVKANGVLIAKGEAVVVDANFGVRITEIFAPSETFEQSEEEKPEPESAAPEQTAGEAT